ATRVAVGAALVLVGIVLAIPFVPGPGLLLIFFGLGLLGREFAWARGLRDRMHDGVRHLTGRPHDGREGSPGREAPPAGEGRGGPVLRGTRESAPREAAPEQGSDAGAGDP